MRFDIANSSAADCQGYLIAYALLRNTRRDRASGRCHLMDILRAGVRTYCAGDLRRRSIRILVYL
jgi:hypothetical protein